MFIFGGFVLGLRIRSIVFSRFCAGILLNDILRVFLADTLFRLSLLFRDSGWLSVYDNLYVVEQFVQVSAPVFTYREEILAGLAADQFQPLTLGLKTDVLDSIQTQRIRLNRFEIPFSPVNERLAGVRVVIVQVHPHQVIVIDIL